MAIYLELNLLWVRLARTLKPLVELLVMPLLLPMPMLMMLSLDQRVMEKDKELRAI
jgi:hypothetical protein